MNSSTVLDVRTYAEFIAGSFAGSINIPLQEIPLRLEEIKGLQQPIVLCCASGNRSGQAAAFLKSCGVVCEKGGSWMALNHNYQTAKKNDTVI